MRVFEAVAERAKPGNDVVVGVADPSCGHDRGDCNVVTRPPGPSRDHGLTSFGAPLRDELLAELAPRRELIVRPTAQADVGGRRDAAS
jgi:hypothetical protein